MAKKRGLFFFLACSFLILVSNPAWANIPPKDVKIPSECALIKETFDNPAAISQTQPLIIHIQDAHCNYEAQKNSAKLLEHLAKNYNLHLIMVEGGSGDVSLSFLRGYADKKARQEVADKYLKNGEISGEEYLDIISDYDIDLYGIDDDALYDQHLAAFWKVDAVKKEGSACLSALDKAVAGLKPYIFSDELCALEDRKAKYDAKTISLADYVRFLYESGRKKALNVEKYQNLSAFAQTADLEKKLDFQKAESQRNECLKSLAASVDEQTLNQLVAKSKEFKEGKVSPVQYYSYLKDFAQGKRVDLAQSYPALSSYISYLQVSKDIDVQKLLAEMNALEEALKEESFANAEQKKLDGVARDLRIVNGFLNLELVPEDYEYFKAHKADFSTGAWKDFLTENTAKYNLTFNIPVSGAIDDNLATFEEFYKLGVAREDKFIENLTKKMKDSGEKIAVLITGGFHTPGITRMLKGKGYSYLVVSPVITQKADPNIYFTVLKNSRRTAEDDEAEGEEE